MKRKKLICEALLTVAFFLALCLITTWLARVYIPKRDSYGALWDSYLAEPEDSIDLMVFGSSLAFCDIIPAAIYEETGVSAYVMAAPEATVPYIYYYVKEALKTQSPRVIFVEISSAYFDEYTNFTDVTVGYMPFGTAKLEAALFASEPEARTGLLFPLYNYHSRWEQTHPSKYFEKKTAAPDPFAGYTLLTEKNPVDLLTRPVDLEKSNFEKNKKYLKKLEALCDKKGVSVEFFIVPSCYRFSDEDVERLRESVRSPLVDFNEGFEDMGLSLSEDFYDRLHLNLWGAEKFSKYFARYGAEKYSIEPSAVNAELWEGRVEHYRKFLAK